MASSLSGPRFLPGTNRLLARCLWYPGATCRACTSGRRGGHDGAEYAGGVGVADIYIVERPTTRLRKGEQYERLPYIRLPSRTAELVQRVLRTVAEIKRA